MLILVTMSLNECRRLYKKAIALKADGIMKELRRIEDQAANQKIHLPEDYFSADFGEVKDPLYLPEDFFSDDFGQEDIDPSEEEQEEPIEDDNDDCQTEVCKTDIPKFKFNAFPDFSKVTQVTVEGILVDVNRLVPNIQVRKMMKHPHWTGKVCTNPHPDHSAMTCKYVHFI
jgi:hypothetical protein